MSGPDPERSDRILAALRENRLDALVCALPAHVLLLTGYWPVMANTVALFTSAGAMYLLLPEDEGDIADRMSDAQRICFHPGSLDEITNAAAAAAPPLTALLRSLHLDHASIGIESGFSLAPSSYLAQFGYGARLRATLASAVPASTLVACDSLLQRLGAVKTAAELRRLRHACHTAQLAYEHGSRALCASMHEPQAAALFHSAFADARSHAVRSAGFFFCMSGPNSATAFAAYARTRERLIGPHDLVMIHCNSTADGFWTDITRTYTCEAPDRKQTAMRAAILEARAAALAGISAGARASSVDAAARDVLTARGFGHEFKHAIGHGVGFSAADHDALPRLHPKSTDILETGMTFNLEPAIYIEGYQGMRHCDVVAITARGAEVLTDFQSEVAGTTLAA